MVRGNRWVGVADMARTIAGGGLYWTGRISDDYTCIPNPAYDSDGSEDGRCQSGRRLVHRQLAPIHEGPEVWVALGVIFLASLIVLALISWLGQLLTALFAPVCGATAGVLMALFAMLLAQLVVR